MVFTRAFCHARVENFLKGPDNNRKRLSTNILWLHLVTSYSNGIYQFGYNEILIHDNSLSHLYLCDFCVFYVPDILKRSISNTLVTWRIRNVTNYLLVLMVISSQVSRMQNLLQFQFFILIPPSLKKMHWTGAIPALEFKSFEKFCNFSLCNYHLI